VEASSVVAVQAVATAKGSGSGDGGTVGAEAMKAQELRSPHHEGVMGVAPEETIGRGSSSKRGDA
jgi:hypothetical protein